ncbi:MAG: peptidylprolyl isomerase [Deltaproteobacteria bacterium]|nr:peptidylprolyl isomerase [Deltaproteobacteria bacterium]
MTACHREKDFLLATVNGESIRKSDIVPEEIPIQTVELSEQTEWLAERKQLLKNLLDQEIDQVLLIQEAHRLKISPSPQEIDHYIQSLKAGKPKEKTTSWRSEAIHQATIAALLDNVLYKNDKPDLEDFRKYYQEHPERFQKPEQIRLRQIVLSSYEQAVQIKQRILTGENFERLAREFSVGPEAAHGGDMGYFSKGELPLEIEKECFNLPTEALSPIVSTSYGYHLFRVEKRYPAGLAPLDSVLPEIMEILYNELDERTELLLERLRERAKIVIYEKNLDEIL